jgi:cell division protease FtsH
MSKKSAKTKSTLLRRLRKHFGADPAALPVLEHTVAEYERPNLHLAVEELVAEADLFGIVVPEDYHTVSISKLSRDATARQFDEGPIEYVDVPLANGEKIGCVKRGLYLFHCDDEPAALLIYPEPSWHRPNIRVEIMAPTRELAESFLRRLARKTQHGQAFRGHVLSLEEDCHGNLAVRFHQLPQIGREQIILPEALLRRIERQTLSFSKHAALLKAAGRHLKRGLLLYGPPGTGKTLTAMYLAARMPGRTVLLITGAGVQAISTACKLARLLEPATVILEDVDLIGTERQHQTVGANALLFELLNEMDGLADDADLLFILTTNRPDVLEPALASRPGRIDQAIEVPPPDTDCRRRLFELYSAGMSVKLNDGDHFISRTAGVSGAFIKEWLRKAAVFAAEDAMPGEPLVVLDRHVEEGLTELLIAGGALTQSLLGVATNRSNSESNGSP